MVGRILRSSGDRDNVPQQLVQYVREHEIPSFVYDHLKYAWDMVEIGSTEHSAILTHVDIQSYFRRQCHALCQGEICHKGMQSTITTSLFSSRLLALPLVLTLLCLSLLALLPFLSCGSPRRSGLSCLFLLSLLSPLLLLE